MDVQRVVVAGLMIFFYGCSTRSDSSQKLSVSPAISASDVARHYKSYQLMTKEPVQVDPATSMLCVSAAPPADVVQTFGPHAHRLVSIFMNDLAADAFRQRRPYAVGAVVIKEKMAMTDPIGSDSTLPHKAPDGVGGMIKRAPGYDAEHGDWEYFYFHDQSTIESGAVHSCVGCHSTAKKSDYVFGNWSKAG